MKKEFQFKGELNDFLPNEDILDYCSTVSGDVVISTIDVNYDKSFHVKHDLKVAKRIIMKSDNGTEFALTVSDDGQLITEAL